jgi:hypothetical protein
VPGEGGLGFSERLRHEDARREDAREWFLDACAEYFRELEQAGLTDEVKARASDAYVTYVQLQQEMLPSAEVQERVGAAYLEYTGVLRDAWASPERARHAHEALLRYVRSVAAAWSAVDVEDVHPQALAAIAHTMLAVAWTAAFTAEAPSEPARPASVVAEAGDAGGGLLGGLAPE